MVRAGLMEKIMNKTNDTSYDVAATSERELTGAELETVTGGTQEDKEQAEALKTFQQVLEKAGQI